MRHSDLDRGKLKILVKAAEHFGRNNHHYYDAGSEIQSPACRGQQYKNSGQLFELDRSEQAVLSLLVTIGNSKYWTTPTVVSSFTIFDHICIFFAHLVDMPAKAVAEVLGSQSKLRRLGILNISEKSSPGTGFWINSSSSMCWSEGCCAMKFSMRTRCFEHWSAR